MITDFSGVLRPLVRYFWERRTKRKARNRLAKAERDYATVQREIEEKQATLKWVSTEIINARSALNDLEAGFTRGSSNAIHAPAREVIAATLAARSTGC